MKRLKIVGFVLCIMQTVQLHGQVTIDSVHLLETVVVTQSRLNDYAIAAYQLPIDSAMLSLASAGNLTDLLRKQGLGHLRSYGPGGLASPSFRGTGSSHTAVLWNGINLSSPLSGQLDLSLVPMGLFDDASIQMGGSTSLSGNGSIGGNIYLNNNLNFSEGMRITVASQLGSFGSQYYNVGFRISNQKIGSSTKVFFNKSENDFKFTNDNVYPPEVQRREHSAFQQSGLLQQIHWQVKNAGIFSLKIWYQESQNEIPNPTTVIRTSQVTEDNEFLRTLVGWNYSEGNFDLNYQGAFVRQDLEYADPAINLFSVNRYNSTINNIESNINFKNKTQLTTGVNHTWEQGIVDDFGTSSPVRNRVSIFSAYKIESFKDWKLALSAREEFVNGKATPFAPGISAKYEVNNALNVFANVSRNYRLPTFNDLYWKGTGAQGNPELKPELSLSGEAGINFVKASTAFKGIVFTNQVDNWIQWSPQSGQIWMAQNIKRVWSRGLESQFSVSKKFGTLQSKAMGQYSFTKSTNESIYADGNPNEKGKQLLLTPMHEASITVEAEWKKYSLRIVNAYTGKQFNDSDNTPYNVVDDYLITNIWLSKLINRENFILTLIGEVNNLFDIQYQARPGYPLPGINYKVGIQINFDKPYRI